MLTVTQKVEAKSLLGNFDDEKLLRLLDLLTLESVGEASSLKAKGFSPDYIQGYQNGLQELKSRILKESDKEGVIR